MVRLRLLTAWVPRYGESDGSLAKVRDVVEGVVALPTAADATRCLPGSLRSGNQGSGDIDNSAIDIAHAMMGKVSALS